VELIRQLAQGPRSAEAPAERLGLSLANPSQHVQQSRRAGLASTQRDGTYVVYRLAEEAETEIVSLLATLWCVAEHAVASMKRVITAYFRARDELEPVAAQEPLVRLRQGDAAIRDACPEDKCGLGSRRSQGTSCRVDGDHRVLPEALRRVVVRSLARLRVRGFRVRRLEAEFPE